MDKFNGNKLVEKSYNLLDPKAVVEGVLDSSGEVTPNSSWYTTDFIPVSGNEYLQIKPTAGSTHVYDSNRQRITSFGSSNTWPVKLPSNASYIRTSFLKSNLEGKYIYLGLGDKPYVDFGFKYADSVYDAKFIKELEDMIKLAQRLVIENSEVEEYVNMFDKNNVMMDKSVSQGVITDSPGFYVYKINVLPGKDLMITPTVGTSSYLDVDGNYISGLNSSSPMPTKVPPGAFELITSGHRNSLDTKMVYYGTEVIPYQEFGKGSSKQQYALSNRLSFNSDGYPIATVPYNSASNLEVEFGALGVNGIHHIRNIKSDYFNHRVTSDFIAPYRVKAVSNPIADNAPFTTGGNHGTDGGTGFPTAKPVSIEAFVDNTKHTKGLASSEKAIVVKVVNDVCGYNTINKETGERRDILREHVTYSITRNNVEISMVIEALEPIVLERWRGLQWQNGPWAEQVYVSNGGSQIVEGGTSFDFTSNTADKIIGFNSNGDIIGMYVNEDYGLGTFSRNTGEPRFFLSGAKAYSRVMNDEANISMSQGDILDFSGGYYFGRGLLHATIKSGKAYVIHKNGKEVYCVDDLRTTSYSEYPLEVLPNDINKVVKELSNKGYTHGGYTTSKGLRLSKTSGVSNLMFEVI